jgi:hypothetical protein
MRQALSPVGGFYKDPDLHWSAQDVLNWIPVPAERSGTRTKWQFRDAPGLKPFVRIVRNLGEGGAVDAGPIRGMRSVEDRLFVVAGTQLYQITNSGVAIPYGNVPGVGRVSMAHNQRGNGNQLLVVNGSAGYVFDTSSLVFQKVTDGGYPGAFIADFVDGYLPQVEPQGRYWFHSDLSNALEYNTLDQYEAEADPDRIITLHVSFREVLVFGKDTIEPYVNSGGSTGTFKRASNTVIQCGCSAKFSPKTMDNSVFFLDDKRIVRRLDGYTPVRVSTVAIEAALAECSREEIAGAFAYTFEDRGHKIYYLTVPGRFTFGYDVLSQEWHRRGSPGLGRLRLNDLVFWNGKWIGGDFQRGRLYELDWNYMLDGADELERERVTGVLAADQQMIEVSEIELVFNVGGEVTAEGSFPSQPSGPAVSGDPPEGQVGVAYDAYSFTLTAGSNSSLKATVAPGDTLPLGLSISAAGLLSGTPTTAGTYSFSVRVTDGNGLWDSVSCQIVIAAAPEA